MRQEIGHSGVTFNLTADSAGDENVPLIPLRWIDRRTVDVHVRACSSVKGLRPRAIRILHSPDRGGFGPKGLRPRAICILHSPD